MILLWFIFLKTWFNIPLIFLFKPIPNKASTTRASFCNLNKFIFLNSPLYSLRAVIIAIFIFSPPSIYTSVFFGITFGLLWLSTVPPTNGIVAQIFGTKYLSTLFGIVFLSHQVGSFIGAYLGGYFYDLYGSYDYAWYIAIALSVFAAMVHLPIDEQPLIRENQTAN